MTLQDPGRDPSAGSGRAPGVVSSIGWGLLLGGLGLVSGALLGGLYVRVFVPPTGMGWDQIADALGGLMVGGTVGAAAGIALALGLSGRGRTFAAVGIIVLGVASVFALRAMREERPAPEPVVREEPFSPRYMVRMNVGRTDELLRGTLPEARPVPLTETTLFTATEGLDFVGWDDELLLCRAEVDRDDLAALVPRVRAAHAEAAAGHCRTDNPDDDPVSISVYFDGERRNATVQADCLAARPAMLALADGIADLADRICFGPVETTEPAGR